MGETEHETTRRMVEETETETVEQPEGETADDDGESTDESE